MKTWALEELRAEVESRPQRTRQLARAEALIREHPDAVILQCADEKTGRRFGLADRRYGQCEKVGGCRQPYWYQMWVSWAPADIRAYA